MAPPDSTRWEDQLISVVVPLEAEATSDAIVRFLEDLRGVLAEHVSQFEIILVDDGPRPGSRAELLAAVKASPGVRYVALSRGYGPEVAISAGLEIAVGDYCVTLLPAFDPPELLLRALEASRHADAVIIGQATSAARPLYRLAKRLFTTLCRLIDVPLRSDATYFMVLPRRAVEQYSRSRSKHRFIRAISSWTGFPSVLLPYELAAPRPGLPRRYRSLWRGILLALDVLVVNSLVPLRVVAVASLVLGFLNLAYMSYVIGSYLVTARLAEGWVTLSAQSAANFSLLFLVLAVVCEYLGRVLHEAMERPLYYVAQEAQADEPVANSRKGNVLAQSHSSVGTPGHDRR